MGEVKGVGGYPMNEKASQKLQVEVGGGVLLPVLLILAWPHFQLSNEMDLRCAEMQKNFESKTRYALWHKFLYTAGPKVPASLRDFSSLGFQTLGSQGGRGR